MRAERKFILELIATFNLNAKNLLLIFAIKLLQQGGVLSLIDCTLIEEPDASDEECKFNTSVRQCVHVGCHTGTSYWLI